MNLPGLHLRCVIFRAYSSSWADRAQSASLVTLNSPKALEHLAAYANTFGAPSKAEQVSRAELLREVGLKCISFIGIAKVINQLGALANATDPAVREALPAQQSRMPTPDNVKSTYERGLALWKVRRSMARLWADRAERLRAVRREAHREARPIPSGSACAYHGEPLCAIARPIVLISPDGPHLSDPVRC